MGAWNYGIFDDDTAYDFTNEIAEDAEGFFRQSFERAISADYLEYDDCHAVTVSAAYLDNLLNGTLYRTDNEDANDISNVNNFGKLHSNPKLEELRPLAVNALKVVIGDNSELNELWSENEDLYPEWRGNIEQMIARLQ